MRRTPILFLSALVAVVATVAPAWAADADEVAAAAQNDGYFVERGASITEAQAGELVADMRNAGEGFVLVVLSDEPGAGATTFADNVQFAMGRGIVLVIAPDSVGIAGDGDVFNEAELESALDVAFNSGGSDFELAAVFVSELTGVPIGATPEPVAVPTTVTAPATQAPATSSGGGNGFLWFIIIVGGLGLLVWWMMRRAKAKAQPTDDGSLNKARYVIQEQLNDVANDILAMEDEVRVADNDRAGRFYEQASETYSDVTEALPKTNTAEGLLDLSNQLDVAIWQLDSAEAILDDKPLPERPRPKRLERPEATRRPAPTPSSGGAVPGPSAYQRRPTRRSSPGGGGIMDLLIMVGGSMVNSRRRSSSRSSRGGGGLGGGLGDLLRRRSQPTQRQSPTPRPKTPTSSQPSSGRQSDPIAGPGRRATPSRTRSSMPKSRSGRGTSRRVRSGRSGRKRRKG